MELLSPLHTFASLTTVEFLKPMLSIDCIFSGKQPQTLPPGKSPYYLSKDGVSRIHETLLNACTELPVAIMAAYSWGAVVRSMREMALDPTNCEDGELSQKNREIVPH